MAKKNSFNEINLNILRLNLNEKNVKVSDVFGTKDNLFLAI